MARAKQPSGEPATTPVDNSPAIAQRYFQWIGIDNLQDPSAPARATLDEGKLQELIDSIRDMGVIEPLCVERTGRMFRVLAGHRRLIAGRALGLTQMPCIVYPPGGFPGEAITHHENKVREDLNVAEEAEYFCRLLAEKCGGDIDRLCSLVHETRQYVENRIVLIQGDQRVMEALRRHEIGLGVALELNAVNEVTRRMMYLDAAVKGGASFKMVRDWRIRGNAQDALEPRPPVPEIPVPAVAAFKAQPKGPECYICHSSEDQHELEILYVHRGCARAVSRFQAAAVDAPVGTEREP